MPLGNRQKLDYNTGMARTYVVANQKGGVGKTTTTANLATYLTLEGYRVLMVDFDPQGNLSSHFGQHDMESVGMYEVLLGECGIQEIIVELRELGIKNLFLAPANLHLSGATVELAKVEGWSKYLKTALLPIEDSFDYILIDCPPSLGVLTLNGFAAADRVLIPLQCEFLALEGLLGMIFNTIYKIQQGVNPGLQIGGIVFTMYDSRTKFANAVINSVRNTFVSHPDYIFNTIIPRNVRLSEAPSHALPISLYSPDCVGARSYKALAKEVIARG